MPVDARRFEKSVQTYFDAPNTTKIRQNVDWGGQCVFLTGLEAPQRAKRALLGALGVSAPLEPVYEPSDQDVRLGSVWGVTTGNPLFDSTTKIVVIFCYEI